MSIRIASDWKDYELLDASGGERLERWGNYTLIRPDPQIMWKSPVTAPEWKTASAKYTRSDSGGGTWEYRSKLPESWILEYNIPGSENTEKKLRFKVKPTGFKHTGIFPEQAVNWNFLYKIIKTHTHNDKKVKVLNLFAYTGGATLACLNAGADVCHLDAVKGMVEWAKENAHLSGLADGENGGFPRWIVDDAGKFLAREIRRGNRYDGIILDPPSYGRGTNGETWKIEDCIYDLLMMCAEILSDKPLFLLMNSYTTGLSPSAVKYLTEMTVGRKYKIRTSASEIGLNVKSTGLALPCGNTTIVEFL